MNKYTAKRRIDHGVVVDGKLQERKYQEGDPIELDDATAKPLLDAGAIEPADPKAKFQSFVRAAEDAARELEEAGGDPGAAARELQQRRQDEARSLDEAVDEVAQAICAGLPIVPAVVAGQICAQLKTADEADVLARIDARVALIKEQKEAAARKAAEESAARKAAEEHAAREQAGTQPAREPKKKK